MFSVKSASILMLVLIPCVAAAGWMNDPEGNYGWMEGKENENSLPATNTPAPTPTLTVTPTPTITPTPTVTPTATPTNTPMDPMTCQYYARSLCDPKTGESLQVGLDHPADGQIMVVSGAGLELTNADFPTYPPTNTPTDTPTPTQTGTPTQTPTFVNIYLPSTTTNATGIVFKNSVRFLHDFHHPTGNTQVPIGRNLWIGEEAGNFTTGSSASDVSHASYNVGVGYQSLDANTTGYYNIGVGALSLTANNTGWGNVSIGTNSLAKNTSGAGNMAIGNQAMYENLTTNYSAGLGYQSLMMNTAHYNTAIGGLSLRNKATGEYNVAIGYAAGRFQADGSTVLGVSANSVYIGAMTRGFNNSDDNAIVIGYGAIGVGANKAVYGNSSITDHYFYGQIQSPEYLDRDNNAYYFDGDIATGIKLAYDAEIGAASADDNDTIYFDQRGESLQWTNGTTKFTFSDDVYASRFGAGGGVDPVYEFHAYRTSTTSSAPTNTMYAMQGNEANYFTCLMNAAGDYEQGFVWSTGTSGGSLTDAYVTFHASTDTMYIGSNYDGTGTNRQIELNGSNGIFLSGYDTGAGTALVIDANGEVMKSSSSARYKTGISDISSITPEQVLSLRPREYERWVESEGFGGTEFGFVAEEVVATCGESMAVYEYDTVKEKNRSKRGVKTDRIDNYRQEALPALLLMVIQKQEQKIAELERRIEKLEKKQ